MQQKGDDVTQTFDIRFASQQLCDHTIAGPIRSKLSIMELLLIPAGYFAVVWLIAPNLKTNGLVPFIKMLLIAFFIYYSFVSPAFIHKDALSERGMGGWRTFIGNAF